MSTPMWEFRLPHPIRGQIDSIESLLEQGQNDAADRATSVGILYVLAEIEGDLRRLAVAIERMSTSVDTISLDLSGREAVK